MVERLRKFSFAALSLVLASFFYSFPALAQEVNDLADNAVTATAQLPALVSAVSYILGLVIGVTGILKLKDHVENSAQTPLRVGVVRLIASGALFSLPMIYEVVFTTINGGGANTLSFDNNSIANDISGAMGAIGGLVGVNFNAILENVVDSIEEVPALVAAVAYLLGLIITVQGILKTKDHVENPDQTPLREGVIRLLIGGTLFAMPAIYNAMFDVVGGNTGIGLASIFAGIGMMYSTYAFDLCLGGFGPSMGDALCGILMHAGAFPAFLTAISYLVGLVLGLWGVLKIRDHVLNPQQTAIWEGVSRLLAGGAFFALPVIVEVARNTFNGGGVLFGLSFLPVTGYNSPVTCSGGFMGLDGVLVCMMEDMMGPLHVVLNFFAFCAGIILLMIGISRLIKSAQDGPRGPGGIGTVMTFVAGSALISYNELVRGFSTTLLGNPITQTNAVMAYTTGMSGAEVDAAHSTITAILQFIIIVGLISFVRGIFIIRGVAEGNQQASVMAGVTHIIAGALAVNLGPLLNAVQTSLNIGAYGIAFS